MCVCVRERESLCACVCVCVRERESLCACVCVCERERESVCMCVCVCIYIYSYCLLGDIFMLKYYTVVLFVELYLNMVFVMSCLYSTVSLTQFREWHFIGIIIIIITCYTKVSK